MLEDFCFTSFLWSLLLAAFVAVAAVDVGDDCCGEQAGRLESKQAGKQAGSESCIMNDSLKREMMVLMTSVSTDEVVIVVMLVI